MVRNKKLFGAALIFFCIFLVAGLIYACDDAEEEIVRPLPPHYHSCKQAVDDISAYSRKFGAGSNLKPTEAEQKKYADDVAFVKSKQCGPTIARILVDAKKRNEGRETTMVQKIAGGVALASGGLGAILGTILYIRNRREKADE
jgi:hypothetical protein